MSLTVPRVSRPTIVADVKLSTLTQTNISRPRICDSSVPLRNPVRFDAGRIFASSPMLRGQVMSLCRTNIHGSMLLRELHIKYSPFLHSNLGQRLAIQAVVTLIKSDIHHYEDLIQRP